MKTLLIDLDDTLLTTNLDLFIKSYFTAFSRHVETYGIGGEGFFKALWAGTQQMIKNRRPDRTLKEAFEDTFYPLLIPFLPTSFRNDQSEKIVTILEEFYEKIFPELKPITEMRPDAINFIDEALSRKYRIVIATNPLFPKTATHQRLEWAGLPVDKYPFELISTYEGFHFTKPNPAYFAEVLAYIGYPEGEIVMIGNDLKDDIQAAQTLGLPTFWVKPPNNGNDTPIGIEPTMIGNLGNVISWLDSIKNGQLIPEFNGFDADDATLRSTPASLLTIFRTLNSDQLCKRPTEDSWALNEIICHLRDVETEIYLPRINKISSENKPFLPSINQELWAVQRNYISQDLQDTLIIFVQSRLNTLNLIESIDKENMEREGIHEIYGNITLSQLIHKIAEHDREHIRQIHDVLHKNRIRVLPHTCNSD